MSDDGELDDKDRLKLVNNFILNSPPGQIQKVVDDVRKLVGNELLEPNLDSLVKRANQDKFVAVQVPGTNESVLLTPAGDLGNGNFLDPAGKQQLVINHAEQKCTSVQPLTEEQRAACGDTEDLRSKVESAMRSYAAEQLPGAVVTTYGRKAAGVRTVECCIGSCNINLSNWYAGQWRSRWVLEARDGESTGKLSGTISCTVHYFEDGNVQLEDSTEFASSVPLQGDVGAALSKQIATFNADFVSSMEEIFQTMSEKVLNALRRRLPITKVKFDWDNNASKSKLSNDLRKK